MVELHSARVRCFEKTLEHPWLSATVPFPPHASPTDPTDQQPSKITDGRLPMFSATFVQTMGHLKAFSTRSALSTKKFVYNDNVLRIIVLLTEFAVSELTTIAEGIRSRLRNIRSSMNFHEFSKSQQAVQRFRLASYCRIASPSSRSCPLLF